MPQQLFVVISMPATVHTIPKALSFITISSTQIYWKTDLVHKHIVLVTIVAIITVTAKFNINSNCMILVHHNVHHIRKESSQM